MSMTTIDIWVCDRCQAEKRMTKGSAPRRWVNTVVSAEMGLDLERGEAPSERVLCDDCANRLRAWFRRQNE